MIETALTDLWYGFGVAIQPHNLMWCFIGVLVGNMVGVLPGMGPLATISILLPLTFGIKPVGAILMLAGVMYGAQYGGAICSVLLNLPCHPPHAVTCLDGFPMTKQGRGGVALGLTVMASFVGASWGITEMIFLSPILVRVALEFGPAEICSGDGMSAASRSVCIWFRVGFAGFPIASHAAVEEPCVSSTRYTLARWGEPRSRSNVRAGACWSGSA